MQLRWCSIYGPRSIQGEPNALYLGSAEVARMINRLDGTWFALLRYPGSDPIWRNCTDEATGRAGCEAWVERHRGSLEGHAERKHIEWLAQQTWRGQAKSAAQDRLARPAPEA